MADTLSSVRRLRAADLICGVRKRRPGYGWGRKAGFVVKTDSGARIGR